MRSNRTAEQQTSSLLRFHNPSARNGDAAENGNERLLEWSVQIGSKQWPEMSTCKSLAATCSLLKQALGIYDQNIACRSITPTNYVANRYCIGVPTSTIPGQVFSGISTRSGDLLTVKINNLEQTAFSAGRIFVHMVAETIVELRESGVQVLD